MTVGSFLSCVPGQPLCVGKNCFKCLHTWERLGKDEPIYVVKSEKNSEVNAQRNMYSQLIQPHLTNASQHHTSLTVWSLTSGGNIIYL